ncbi:MAG TPA: hypothetical protein VH143_02675 [Kofleriaceae bacterium]|nr:hypothetical protein [Kofleriaceae bacterium]
MNVKAFFGDALGQALELGIGTADDVLRHVTPDVLSTYLPRPLWARMLTACLGAPKVDAQLVIETIGVPNLCEHVPAHIIWACIAEIGARSVGQTFTAAPPVLTRASLSTSAGPPTRPTPPPMNSVLAPPPAPATVAASEKAVTQPIADLITELESDERPITPQRGRTPTGQRFRQSNTGIGRVNQTAQPRRPMATASTPPATPPAASKPRRTGTEADDAETEAEGWRSREIAVDDSQLVDWQASETTQASTDDDFSDIGRKR